MINCAGSQTLRTDMDIQGPEIEIQATFGGKASLPRIIFIKSPVPNPAWDFLCEGW